MEHRQALPSGTQLFEFEILHVLGSGGFGVVYLAKDTNLGENIVIKEYLPNHCAIREADQTIKAKSPKDEEEFEWGLKSFLTEAQALATFRSHPNIVNVLRFFRANETGYMVMEHIEGTSLGDYLKKHQVLSENQICALIFPLLDALEAVHDKGMIHRDLKPDNILINTKGEPVLIDFGAARHALGVKSMNITAIISPGYSPFEQYSANAKQGAWTDIYALAGVMYRCVTGKTPLDAIERKDSDDYISVKENNSLDYTYSPSFLGSIDWALRLNAKERPQSIEEWKEKLFEDEPNTIELAKNIIEKDKLKWISRFILSMLFLLLIGGGIYYTYKNINWITEDPDSTAKIYKNTDYKDVEIESNALNEYVSLSLVEASKIIRNQKKYIQQIGILKDNIDLLKMSPGDKDFMRNKKIAERGLKTITKTNLILIENYASYIKKTCVLSTENIDSIKYMLKRETPELYPLTSLFERHRQQYCKSSIIDEKKWLNNFLTFIK